MEDVALRNFRDFLTIYNQMTELCFSRCVDSLNYRQLSPDEVSCVDKCASKHVNINHRMMSIYMEVQPQIVSRRIEEMNQQNQLAVTPETGTTESIAITPNQEITSPTGEAIPIPEISGQSQTVSQPA
uniref:Mitochondrial import inner membrane translocase subunit n=1 Tax=Strigamia maritima TaxID=126957 RepID=T1JAV5_STRMM